MKLFYAPGACSLSPHIVLREANLRFDLERVDLKTHRTASGADFLAINPKGYVPILLLDGGSGPSLTEVSAILQYIGDLAPEAHLVPPSGSLARYHLQEWLNFIATEIHKQFEPVYDLGDPGAPGAPRAPRDARTLVSIAEYQRGKISRRFLYLQDVLDDRAFLMGETFTVADAYLFVMLQWCTPLGIDLALFPNLADYDQRIMQRPAVQAALSAEGLLDHHRYRSTG